MGKPTKTQKTNATRLLDHAGISYTLIPYAVDEEHLDAIHVAAELGEDIRLVYKTLVLQGAGVGLFVCVIRGDKEVDLKKAAKVIGAKKVEMLPMKNLLSNTGYIRGGCSPIGMKKELPTIIQEECLNHDYIYISAGKRGLQICISPRELISFVNAKVADVAADNEVG